MPGYKRHALSRFITQMIVKGLSACKGSGWRHVVITMMLKYSSIGITVLSTVR